MTKAAKASQPGIHEVSDEPAGLPYDLLTHHDVRLDPATASALIYGSPEDDQEAALPMTLDLGDELPAFVVFSAADFRLHSLSAVTVQGELLTPKPTLASLTIFRRSLLRRAIARLLGREAAVHGRLAVTLAGSNVEHRTEESSSG